MLQRARKAVLFLRIVCYVLGALAAEIRRSASARIARLGGGPQGGQPRTRNIVVVGANFAGYHAARLISAGLPRGSPFCVVVVEPHSHFNFTWVLPRFCVARGHEHKAFIPYAGYLSGAPGGAVRWVRDRVASVGRAGVTLRAGGGELPYEYLVVATGSDVAGGLPSRVGADSKAEGFGLLRGMQRRVRAARRVVVAGGGAAGVELATDAKAMYPDKTVVLVHSQAAVMNRFGPGLQRAALEGLQRLGVEVVLEQRVTAHDETSVTVTSGREIGCDCYINCTGQTPSSGILGDLAPGAIAADGHIRIKPTLQILDDTLPNVYVCGDVADTHARNPNARAAMVQAAVVANNVCLAVRGKPPRYTYAPAFGDGFIKLTLGLDLAVIHFFDGKDELQFNTKEKDLAFMCGNAWSHMGAKPFEDPGFIEYLPMDAPEQPRVADAKEGEASA